MTENVFDCLSIRPAANRRRANRTIVDPRRVACRHKASTGEARHLLAPAVGSASAQALLANESRLFEMIATGRPLSETLAAICGVIERAVGGSLCGLARLDPSGARLDDETGAGFAAGLSAGRAVDAESDPCAAAAALNRQIVAADLRTDRRWLGREWCSRTMARGLRACWSMPIADATGKVLGVLSVYRWQPGAPQPQHRALIGRFVRIAAIAIERAPNDAAFQRNETLLQEAEEAIAKLRSELARVARVSSLAALTASIAHEINQPLAGIVTNAGVCLRKLTADSPNVEGARETAHRIIRDASRVSDVIGRLRSLFCRSDTTSEAVDLNEVTREVIAMSLGEIGSRQAVLREEYAGDLPIVTGDRVQLQQVILNLLLNALDAMAGIHDRPRQLVVKTERDGRGGARLSVQDVGVGLDRENAERLFEPFYTTKSGGMGIGLFISRSIIEGLGGRLWAAPNDGPGATFSFTVPE